MTSDMRRNNSHIQIDEGQNYTFNCTAAYISFPFNELELRRIQKGDISKEVGEKAKSYYYKCSCSYSAKFNLLNLRATDTGEYMCSYDDFDPYIFNIQIVTDTKTRSRIAAGIGSGGGALMLFLIIAIILSLLILIFCQMHKKQQRWKDPGNARKISQYILSI